jgi:hypothetical protein
MRTPLLAVATFATLLATLVCKAAAPSPDKPLIPADIAAMTKEHLGSWQTTGWFIDGGKKTPVKANWECRDGGGGPGLVCIWHHESVDAPPDTEHELIGFDKAAGKLSFTRIHEDGMIGTAFVDVGGKTMSRRWEWTEDGKKAVGRNHIVVREPGLWEQHVTVEIDGKLVREMDLTQTRTATF